MKCDPAGQNESDVGKLLCYENSKLCTFGTLSCWEFYQFFRNITTTNFVKSIAPLKGS